MRVDLIYGLIALALIVGGILLLRGSIRRLRSLRARPQPTIKLPI
jgi:hypothetical protein